MSASGKKEVTVEMVDAINVSTFKEFLAAFEAEKPSFITRAKTIQKEIEADLGVKLPDSLAQESYDFHLNFIRENKAAYEKYLNAMQNKKNKLKQDLEKGNAWDPYRDYAELTWAESDGMLQRYKGNFYWPQFRIGALHTAYQSEAVQSGAVTQDALNADDRLTIKQLKEKADIALPKGGKLFGIRLPTLPTLSAWGEEPSRKVSEAAIKPLYRVHDLANTMLYFFEPDIKHARAYMHAYDPRCSLWNGGHDGIQERAEADFAKYAGASGDAWVGLKEEALIEVKPFDPKGTRESYTVDKNPRKQHPPKIGITSDQATTIISHFSQATDDQKKVITEAVGASEQFRLLMLKLRIGGLSSLEELKAAKDKLLEARRNFGTVAREHCFKDQANALPREVLGFRLNMDTGYYEASLVSAQYFSRTFDHLEHYYSAQQMVQR